MKKTIIKKYFNLSRASIIGIAITFGILFWELNQGLNTLADSALNRIEYFFYDLRYRLTLDEQQHQSEHNIVILDIDERSLQVEGRWQWSRLKIAKLVEKLAEQGAAVVAFDIVFSEPERNPATELLENYPVQEIESSLKKIEQFSDADKTFASSFQHTDVILGYFFDFEGSKVGALPPAVAEIDPAIADKLIAQPMSGIISNLAVLQDAARGAGSVFTITDADGVIRRSPLVIPYDGKLYPSLSLASAMAYLFVEEVSINISRQDENSFPITSVSVSEFPANTDATGRVLVPYIGRQKSFPYISATDVLNDNVPEGALTNAIVLVGTSALGLKDLRTTPFEAGYPGVEVHASILKGLLEGGIPFQPDWESGLIRFLIIFVGIFLAVLMPNLGSVAMLSTGGAALIAYFILNYYLWVFNRFDLSQVTIILLISSITVLNITIGFFQESSRRRNLREMFGQYVPPAHIDRMVSSESQDAFASDSREMTVLFSDIRNFTSISEGLSAEKLKQMLNEYFTPITQIIFETEGTIDKYVGDMVMAFWGAPLEDQNHREHALEASLAMLKKTEQLKAEFKAKGFPEISIGIGLNSGLMNVGDMGSHYRRAYTVLGDAVNLSSRLESLTKFYGVQCLVGEGTIQDIEQYAFRHVDRIQVKGKQQSVNVFEPLGKKSELSESILNELNEYHVARQEYLNRNWDKAKTLFETLLQQNPEVLIYQIYLERISENRKLDLASDWDGTFKHSSK